MAYNKKSLLAAAPPQGDILRPTTYGKPVPIDDLSGLANEGRRIYRKVCSGKIPVEDATKLVWIIERLSRMTETALLEDRLKAIEIIIHD
jgi:hypothetical protein